jgi:hypothetical protein
LPVWLSIKINPRLADKQMDMLGHHHIPDYLKVATAADALRRLFKKPPGFGCLQVHLAVVTTEGHEVKVLELLLAL